MSVVDFVALDMEVVLAGKLGKKKREMSRE